MYKRTSLMTGANIPIPNRRYPKRSKHHGQIFIRVLAGVVLNPPLILPGDWSTTMECDHCHDLFGLKPETPVIVLPLDPKRKYRIFCSDLDADSWIENEEMKNNRKDGIE